jgi:hypothetical protein
MSHAGIAGLHPQSEGPKKVTGARIVHRAPTAVTTLIPSRLASRSTQNMSCTTANGVMLLWRWSRARTSPFALLARKANRRPGCRCSSSRVGPDRRKVVAPEHDPS